MRICLVTSELAPFRGWGVGSANAALVRALAAAGAEVHVLTDDLPGLRERGSHEFPRIHIHILHERDFAAALHQHPCEATRRPIVVHRRLLELHAALRFDAIEFNDFFGDAYMALQARRTTGEYAGVKMAVHLHSPIMLLRHINAQPEYDMDIATILHMEATAIHDADILFTPSRAMLNALKPLHPLLEDGSFEQRAHVVPYAFEAPETPTAPRDSAQPPSILFFGRLETRKGPQVLVAAAQALLGDGLDLTVRIVGVDTDCGPGRRSMRAHLERLVQPQWRRHFEFLDNQPRDAVAHMVREATLCCFPSLWDNYPNACIEAMAMGAAVVSTNAGGVAELIEHNVSGVLVPPNDQQALAEGLSLLMSDAGVRARLGANAKARVLRITHPASVAAVHLGALSDAHAHPARPRPPRMDNRRNLTALSPDAGGVSIIIPVYNLGRTLAAAVQSATSQTRQPLEIIVIDDGSTDAATIQRISEIEQTGVQVHRQANRGLSAARNAGLALARGRWVLPLDADDLLDPAFIEKCLDAAARNPEASVITSHMACFSGDPNRPELLYVPLGLLREVLPAENIASSAIALIDAATLRAVGGYDESLPAYEDWDLYCRLAAKGYDCLVVPQPLIQNRVRRDSLLRSMSDQTDRHLRAVILSRHMSISPSADRTARIVLGRGPKSPAADTAPAEVARRMVQENLRYRIADAAHGVVRALGMEKVMKKALLRGQAAPAESTQP